MEVDFAQKLFKVKSRHQFSLITMRKIRLLRNARAHAIDRYNFIYFHLLFIRDLIPYGRMSISYEICFYNMKQ